MDELDQIIDKMMAANASDEDIQFVVGEWKAAKQSGPGALGALSKAKTIGADNQSLPDRVMDKFSNLGPVPGVIAGVARHAIGGVAGLADYLVPDSIAKPIPFRTEPMTPDERVGDGLATASDHVGLAVAAAEAPAALKAAARPLGRFLRYTGGETGKMFSNTTVGGFGKLAERIGNKLDDGEPLLRQFERYMPNKSGEAAVSPLSPAEWRAPGQAASETVPEWARPTVSPGQPGRSRVGYSAAPEATNEATVEGLERYMANKGASRHPKGPQILEPEAPSWGRPETTPTDSTGRVPYRGPDPVGPPNPNANGTLVTSHSTPQAIDDALAEMVDSVRNPKVETVEQGLSHPKGGEATTPAGEGTFTARRSSESKAMLDKAAQPTPTESPIMQQLKMTLAEKAGFPNIQRTRSVTDEIARAEAQGSSARSAAHRAGAAERVASAPREGQIHHGADHVPSARDIEAPVLTNEQMRQFLDELARINKQHGPS